MDSAEAPQTAMAEVVARLNRDTGRRPGRRAPQVALILKISAVARPESRDWVFVPDPLD
ncbi:MAG: hypothetical protein ABR573_10090 [Candidatus Dormibacteria bacterium]